MIKETRIKTLCAEQNHQSHMNKTKAKFCQEEKIIYQVAKRKKKKNNCKLLIQKEKQYS